MATFTKKAYIAITGVIAKNAATTPFYLRQNFTEGMADMFEKDNPNFDRDRFIAACQASKEEE